jgi:hypothetical protein
VKRGGARLKKERLIYSYYHLIIKEEGEAENMGQQKSLCFFESYNIT